MEAILKKLEVLAAPLIIFTETYLKIGDNEPPDITKETSDSLKSILSSIEKLLVAIREAEYQNLSEDALINVWGFKELILKTLIILILIDRFSLLLYEQGLLDRAKMLHDRLIVEFTNKALESPEVREAIEKGTIEKELELRKEKIESARKHINKLKEQYQTFKQKQEFYEKIPDVF